MLPRTLEPEVMDTVEEATDYDAMDHSEVNRAFVDDFLEAVRSTPLAGRLQDRANPLAILDAGTGTAQIPIELCRRPLTCTVVAVDLAREMLKLARQNVTAAGLEESIVLEYADSKRLPHGDATFDAVMSNSIVHHIPEPRTVFEEMWRVLRPGGILFVRDLLRPADSATLDSLVATYAAETNAHQRRLFRNSLHAALTVEEIGTILAELGLRATLVQPTSDRHWTVVAQR